MAISVGTAVGYLELDTSRFTSGFATARTQLQAFANSSNSVSDRFTSLGNGLKTIGSNMSKYVTVPIVGLGTASVVTAANFEKSMSNVAALSGATGKDLEALTNIAKEMGAKTQFSASEAADALGYMALAGWKTEQSMSALPGILDLAAASNMGLAEASDMVTDYLSAFQEEADQAGRMADVLAYAQANSNTTTQGLGEAFKNCAVNANSFGMDIEQATATLGKLADQGLKGSNAGTALSAVIRDMSSKMKDGAIQIGKTSVKITDAKGNFLDMSDIVRGISKATDGMSESQKIAAMQTTFTADSIKAMGILTNVGADELAEFTNNLYESDGAASEMAATMNDNLSGQITQLKSALEGAAISIGEALMPMIKQLVEWLNNAVTWFNNLSPSMQTTIVAIAGVIAAIGPVILILGNLCIAIGGLITFFSAGGVGAAMIAGAIGLITGPVGIVIAIIGALIAIGVLLYKNWDEIKAKCSEVWNNVKEVTSQVWENIKTSLMNTWNSITESVTTTWNNITSAISGTWESIKTTTETIWNGVLSFLNGIWQGIWNFISPIVNFIGDLISITWNFISSTTSTIWNSIIGIIKSVWDLIVAVVQLGAALIELVVTVAWGAIKDATTNVWNVIKDVISTVWNGIKSAIEVSVNFIKNIITTVFNAIKSFITIVVNGWKNIITTVWNAIKPVVSAGANAMKTVITTVFNAIKSFITTVWNGIKTVISTVWSGIKTVVSTGANLVKSTISRVFNTLETILTAPFKAAQRVISGILGGITGAINKVTSGVKNVTSMFKMVEDPMAQQNDIQTYANEMDYSKAQFNYATARQTTVSDAMASNYSMLERLKDFTSDIKIDAKNAKDTKVKNDSNVNISLNIEKFINETEQSIDDLMDEIAFRLKRKAIF